MLTKGGVARAALVATARVQSAAGGTANVHGSREPTGDDGAAAEDGDQDGSVQKKILQLLRAFGLTFTSFSGTGRGDAARVHTLPGTQCQARPRIPLSSPARPQCKLFRAVVGVARPHSHGDSFPRRDQSRVHRGDSGPAHHCTGTP